MDIKIGAAYVRVSTDDQLEYSPDSQLKTIREHAKRMGYFIPDEYVYREEDGISGKSAEKRPKFRLMIATAKQDTPPFEAIFVWKYSRFARNQEEAIMYKNLLKKKGITVVSISEPSSDSPFASLIERIIEWMDEYYLINLSSEVRRGMTEKATRGEAMGTAPFGYTVKDKSFIANDDAEIVRYIFSRYAAGGGMREIASELAGKGVLTRRGNVPDNRWVKYILNNPAYIGKVRWSTEGHANYTRANYSGENVMIVDGKHEPIIDMETWENAQARLKARDSEIKYVRRSKPKVFMLKGLVRCGDCGATLTLLSTASPSLQCNKYSRGQCRVSHSITLAKANATVIASLEEAVASMTFPFAPVERAPKKINRDWDRLIASEELRLNRAKNALLDGALESGEYKEIKADIASNIERLKAAKSEDEKETWAEIDMDAYKSRVNEVLSIVKDADESEAAKNQALRSIIEKVVFSRPNDRFDIYFLP